MESCVCVHQIGVVKLSKMVSSVCLGFRCDNWRAILLHTTIASYKVIFLDVGTNVDNKTKTKEINSFMRNLNWPLQIIKDCAPTYLYIVSAKAFFILPKY